MLLFMAPGGTEESDQGSVNGKRELDTRVSEF